MNRQQPITIYYSQIGASPAGPLWVAVTDRGLYALEFDKPEADFLQILKRRASQVAIRRDEAHTLTTSQQIIESLQMKRAAFELEIDLSGNDAFQQEFM